MAADATFMPKCYLTGDGDVRVTASGGEDKVESGGTLNCESGATVTMAADITRAGDETITGATTFGAASSIVTASGAKSTPAFATRAASWSATAAESGQVILITASGVVCTLPATVAGLNYTFIEKLDGAGFQVSPNASDQINGLAANKDLINTGATGLPNDMVTVVGDGADGWFTTALGGIWAIEG